MKRHNLLSQLGSAMVIVALLLPAFSACKTAPEPAKENVPANPFTNKYELTENDLKFFTSSDSVALLTAATPFYIASQPLPQQKTSAYENARAAKITEVKREAQSLVQATAKLKPKLEEVRNIYLKYLQTSVDAEPKLQPFAAGVVGEMVDTTETEGILEATYNSVDTTKVDSAYARSFLDYMRVVKAAELGSVYLQDMENLAGYAAITLVALSKHDSAVIKKAGEQLDQDMKKLDDLKPDALAVIASRQKIDYGLRQLDTGSYYFALAANDFISGSLRDLEAQVDQLKPREGLTKENILVIQQYVAQFEKQLYQLKYPVQNFDKSKLITVDIYPYRPGAAYAADPPGSYPKAVAAMRGPAKADDAAIGKSGYMGKGWAATRKDATSMVTPEVQGAVARQVLSTIQSGLGQAIDVSKIYTDYAITWGYRKAFGIPKDVLDENQEMSKNWMRYQQNLQNNLSGVEVLNNAQKNFTTLQNTSGQATTLTFKTLGADDWLASGLGETSRLGVGLLTGTANNIFVLANQSSTPAELAMATFGLGLSMYGGAKTLATAPFIKNAEEKMAMNAGEALANKFFAGAAKQEAKAAMLLAKANGEIAEAEKHMAEMYAQENIQNALRESSRKILEAAAKLPKGDTLWNMVDKVIAAANRSASNWSKSGGLRETLERAFGANDWDFALKVLNASINEKMKKQMGLFVEFMTPAPTLPPSQLAAAKPGVETKPQAAANPPAAAPAAKPSQPSVSAKPTTAATATLGKPDLTVMTPPGVIISPQSGTAGQTLAVSFELENKGQAASGPFSYQVSLATTQYGTTNSVGKFDMESIPAGQFKDVRVTVTIPQSIPGGDYYVTVFVDNLQKVTEANEDNNIGSSGSQKFSVRTPERWTGKATGATKNTVWGITINYSLDFNIEASFISGGYDPKGTATITGTATVTGVTLDKYAEQSTRVTGGQVNGGKVSCGGISKDLGEIWLLKDVGDHTMTFGTYSNSKGISQPMFAGRGIVLIVESNTGNSISGRWRFGAYSYCVVASDSPNYRFTLTKQVP